MPKVKLTQAERRASTIGRLLDATNHCLSEFGYARTTTAAVCKQAGLSQGALFRHFPTRAKLIAGATAHVCARHLELIAPALAGLSLEHSDPARALVETIRMATRTADHAAWHEVMVAARTDVELRALVAPTLKSFEQSLLRAVGELDGSLEPSGRVGTIMLSLMHLFDSESVTVAVYGNETLEADRVVWLTELLRRELGPTR